MEELIRTIEMILIETGHTLYSDATAFKTAMSVRCPERRLNDDGYNF